MFFGGGGGGGTGGRTKNKSKPMVHKLGVTLEELYNGKVRKLAANRDLRCDECDGKGGKSVKKCTECNGMGVKLKTRQMGPMLQQMQVPCAVCDQRGEIVGGPKCKACKGKRTVREKKILEIKVEKGMPSKHKFRFSGEGDHEPGKEPGDIIIQLEEKPHDLYQRHGRDLSMRMDVSLSESLCGFKRVLKTLDKRDIIIQTKPGEVIKHGAIKMVPEEGFPTHKDPFNKGRLIIVFNVQFPDQISPDAAKKIASALPKVPKPDSPKNSEEVKMQEFDGQGKWGGEDEANGDDEEDDEEDQGCHGPQFAAGGPQQCAQQ